MTDYQTVMSWTDDQGKDHRIQIADPTRTVPTLDELAVVYPEDED